MGNKRKVAEPHPVSSARKSYAGGEDVSVKKHCTLLS